MDFAEQVKSAASIEKVIGEYMRLKKAGPARFSGLCPFHSEKTPSFSVNAQHQFFKCFGCGAGGDVFKFVMQIEGFTFFESLKALAERYGIPIPQRRQFTDTDTELREAVYRMNEIAAKSFVANLFGSAGGDARAYLAKRGLTQAAAETFALGYSERSGQSMVRLLQHEGFDEKQLEGSGLVLRRQDGSGFFDRFRNRLMFPIHNESGKVIGFGGRALSADDEPKYLNSPKTEIYDKSSVLYNLHRAKEGMRRQQFAVLVEGYMDVIGVAMAGVKHVVASCGTALTANQVRSIKRHTEQIVVNFDPDTAGANAAERSIQMLLDEGMSVKVLTLEEGLDPDDYIKKFGADTYQRKLAQANGYFTWLADRARQKFDMRTADGRMSGFEFLLPAIQKIHDRIERAAIVNEVADYLNVERGLVLDYFRKSAVERTADKTRKRAPDTPLEERIVLRSLLTGPDVRDLLVARLRGSEFVRRWVSAPLIEIICKLHETKRDFQFTELEARLGDRDKDLLSLAVFADNSDECFSPQQAEAWLLKLEREERDALINGLRARIKEAERSGDMQGALNLMQELNQVQRG